jgi:hypothetical protein
VIVSIEPTAGVDIESASSFGTRVVELNKKRCDGCFDPPIISK